MLCIPSHCELVRRLCGGAVPERTCQRGMAAIMGKSIMVPDCREFGCHATVQPRTRVHRPTTATWFAPLRHTVAHCRQTPRPPSPRQLPPAHNVELEGGGYL